MSEPTLHLHEEILLLARRFARQAAGQTLQPTALVHEAYLKLVRLDDRPRSPAHFKAIAAAAVRQVLIDHARRRKAAKRNCGTPWLLLGGVITVHTPEDFLDLERALTRLEEFDPRACRCTQRTPKNTVGNSARLR